MILEACVDSLSQALSAQSQGANRIELCSRLELGGLSPGRDTILQALKTLRIPLKVMVRSRAGDFIYSEEELSDLEQEILYCKSAGVKELVFGASLGSGRLDIPAIRRFAAVASPLSITIHKAIDLSPDPLADLEALRTIENVTHILSSGKEETALKGAPLLREMIRAFGERFAIIAAGKVTRNNLSLVHEAIGATNYHGRLIVGPLD